MTERKYGLFALLSAVWAAACVQAPNVAVVDQRTALERQAAGEYPALEHELHQASVTPRPEPYARESIGRGNTSASLGSLAELVAGVESDAETIDAMLLEQCIGESLSGLLVPRPDDCRAGARTAEMARLVGRANLHRRQIWQLIAAQQETSLEQAQAGWAAVHRDQIVCGGLVEKSNATWEPKACE